jgi:alpha-galactosidase
MEEMMRVLYNDFSYIPKERRMSRQTVKRRLALGVFTAVTALATAYYGIAMAADVVPAAGSDLSYSFAGKTSPEEMSQLDAWVATAFGNNAANAAALPFSFIYDGKPSSELLKTWTVERTVKKLNEQRSEITIACTDPKTGLSVRCVAIVYRDFPTVEWTLYFKNGGQSNTPIIENIEPLDAQLLTDDDGDIVLHHQRGSLFNRSEYQPFTTVLMADKPTSISTSGGRPTQANMPYFNMEKSGQGVIAVIGWPGQWAASFVRDGAGVRVRGGQELTHFKLLSGEEVRSPLIVLQFWKGDRIRSQNIWRRWMVEHNLPRPGGKLPPPLMTPCSSHQFGEMIGANEANQKHFIDLYLEKGLKPDYWWMDAGWYPQQQGWTQVGTWEIDPARFPNGFRPICDYAHQKDLKVIVWFEPERVAADTWLSNNHPEWIIGGKGGGLLNLGNPDAWKWVVEHIDGIISSQGIDLYRQDFNMEPLSFWRSNDAKDRQGITEIKHVTGYLAYWDELRRRHPDMLIDSCASGGRRNDLETLRRGVPLLRTDYHFDPIVQQSQMYGISSWIPYNGTGTIDRVSLRDSKINYGDNWVPKGGEPESDTYLFRSVMSLHLTPCYDMRREDLDYPTLQKLWSQWRQVSPDYYGDYYPLTPYSMDKNVWMAWQFDRPEVGRGVVQAFRRAESSQETATLKLRGLDPKAMYLVTDLDVGQTRRMSGGELLDKGLSVTIAHPSEAVVVTYQKVD